MARSVRGWRRCIAIHGMIACNCRVARRVRECGSCAAPGPVDVVAQHGWRGRDRETSSSGTARRVFVWSRLRAITCCGRTRDGRVLRRFLRDVRSREGHECFLPQPLRSLARRRSLSAVAEPRVAFMAASACAPSASRRACSERSSRTPPRGKPLRLAAPPVKGATRRWRLRSAGRCWSRAGRSRGRSSRGAWRAGLVRR
jgi:hypothetical protein